VLSSRCECWLQGRRASGAASAPTLVESAPYALVVAQLALWVHAPSERTVDGALRADTERFLASVAHLERDGEVLLVGRGHVTRARHFQMSALADVVRVGPPPPDLVAALASRRLAAVVDDARGPADAPLGLWSPVMLEDVPALRDALFANYFTAERNDEQTLRIAMPAPGLPRWVYRPRRRPLGALGGEAVARRHFAEMVLADRRSAAVRAGHPPPFAVEDIEELAARDEAGLTPR